MGERFVDRQGLLVPADAVTTPAGAAAELREELVAARELVAVQREDEWVRRAQRARHEMALADVDEHACAAKRARQERALDAHEAEELANLYRKAARSGERARIRAQIQGSAEMRALRVAKVRTTALKVGIPVLAAFAAWSTTGAQSGAVRLLSLTGRSAAWFASWGVEPALITIVALVIIGRAVLSANGGGTDWRATAVEWAALSMSLALNIVGGWPAGAGWRDWTGIVTALPHAIGPVGCAGTALLISLFDGYVSGATPWEGAPRLSELGLTPPQVPAVPSPGWVGRDSGGQDNLTGIEWGLSSALSSDLSSDRDRLAQDNAGTVPTPALAAGQDRTTGGRNGGQDSLAGGRTGQDNRRGVTRRPPGTTRPPVVSRRRLSPVALSLPSGDETAEVADLLPVAREVAAQLLADGAVLSRPTLLVALRERQVQVSTTRAAVLTRVLKAERVAVGDSGQDNPPPPLPAGEDNPPVPIADSPDLDTP